MMYGYPWYGGHMFGFGFGWIFSIIFWVLAIMVIVALVRALSGKGGCWHMGGKEDDEAMRILRERYAKGEIGKEEFEKKKSDLTVK